MNKAGIILTALVFLALGKSGAGAHTHPTNHSNHANHQAGINPFKSGTIQKAAHCLLHHHRYPTQICPHHQHNPDSPIHELAIDCGGSPAGSLPNTLFQSAPAFLISGNGLASILVVRGSAPSSRFPTQILYYDLSPPPPESI